MWFRNRTTDLFIYVRKRVLNWEVKDMIIDKKKKWEDQGGQGLGRVCRRFRFKSLWARIYLSKSIKKKKWKDP